MNDESWSLTLVKEAKKGFMFAALEFTAIQNGVIKYSGLPSTFTLTLPGGMRGFRIDTNNQLGLQQLALNQLRGAFCIWAIGVDSLIEEHFHNKAHEDESAERRAARCAIYMIRCAFAHNPVNPKWEAKKQYQAVFKVASIDYTLDAREIDGKLLDQTGFNWFKSIDLLKYGMQLVGSSA
jgi:hypothetical protein